MAMIATKGKVNMQNNLKWRSNKTKPKQEIEDKKEHSHKLMRSAILVAYGSYFLLERQAEPLPKKKKRQFQDLLQKS